MGLSENGIEKIRFHPFDPVEDSIINTVKVLKELWTIVILIGGRFGRCIVPQGGLHKYICLKASLGLILGKLNTFVREVEGKRDSKKKPIH